VTSVPGFGTRREAREDALAVLYEAEIAGGSSEETLGRRAVPPSDYAMEISLGVDADRENLDNLLRRHLDRWRVERLAVVDRALARIAAWELVHRDDVPTGVVLSEAVALATQYCGGDAPRFLNGVLRAVADEVRPEGSTG
jgi:N utilization substance protein B